MPAIFENCDFSDGGGDGIQIIGKVDAIFIRTKANGNKGFGANIAGNANVRFENFEANKNRLGGVKLSTQIKDNWPDLKIVPDEVIECALASAPFERSAFVSHLALVFEPFLKSATGEMGKQVALWIWENFPK